MKKLWCRIKEFFRVKRIHFECRRPIYVNEVHPCGQCGNDKVKVVYKYTKSVHFNTYMYECTIHCTKCLNAPFSYSDNKSMALEKALNMWLVKPFQVPEDIANTINTSVDLGEVRNVIRNVQLYKQ